MRSELQYLRYPRIMGRECWWVCWCHFDCLV